jgi:hypothetical protein
MRIVFVLIPLGTQIATALKRWPAALFPDCGVKGLILVSIAAQ